MLCYLALEGPSPRSRLAGLLWPEAIEGTARNNLSQALRRLRVASGLAPAATGDRLTLPTTLAVDASDLEVALFEGRYEDAARPGEVLRGIDYDDLPEFADWLLAQRERLVGLRRKALAAASDRLEAAGDLSGAAEWATRLVESDNLSEAAYRRLMRLRYLTGDRSGALTAYQACSEILRRELGVAPSPETANLAEEIKRREPPRAKKLEVHPIPLAVQRPPKLAGRDREWAALETAWKDRVVTFISGAAGVGKSRLLQDFVSTSPPFELLVGRPGDALVPYGFLAAAWRKVLARLPGLGIEDWVRTELGRFLPGGAARDAPPLASEADRLRLLDAVAATGAALTDHLAVIAIDDLHHLDAASLEGLMFLLSRAAEQRRSGPRLICTFRQEEATEPLRKSVAELVAAGLAVHVEVRALDAAGTRELLASLGLPEVERLDEQIARFTGGNPLFITETLKSLYQTGAISDAAVGRLPVPGRVTAVLERRLDRLSDPARRLVTARAVAMPEGGLELLARLVESNPLDLAPAVAELEAAHILQDGEFTHELLYDVTLSRIPAPVRAVLHGRVAELLARQGGSPARVGHHYLQAGLAAQAVPYLVAAAEAAERSFRPVEAAEFYDLASRLLEEMEEVGRAFEMATALARVLTSFDVGERHAGAVERLRRLAVTSEQRVRARLAGGVLHAMRGEADATLAETARGLEEFAAASGELRAELLNLQGVALRRKGAHEEALASLQATLAIIGDDESSTLLPAALNNLALVQSEMDQHGETVSTFRRAFELQTDRATKARVLANLAKSLAETGQVRAALAELATARDLLASVQGGRAAELMVRLTVGVFQRQLGEYQLALDSLSEARALATGFQHWRTVDLSRQLAAILLELGAHDEADSILDAVLSDEHAGRVDRAVAWMLKARLRAERGEAPGEAITRACAELESTTEHRVVRRLRLLQADLGGPDEGFRAATELIPPATAAGLTPTLIAAHTIAARHSLALGHADPARCHAEAAIQLLETRDTLDFYRPRVRYTAFEVLRHVDEPAALDHLETASQWVLTRAASSVPPDHRQSFLEKNRTNWAILAAARAAGLHLTLSSAS